MRAKNTRRFAGLAFLCVGLMVAGGCKLFQKKGAGGTEAEVLYRSAELMALRKALTKNYGAIKTLKASTDVVIDDPGRGRYALTGVLAMDCHFASSSISQ